MYSNSDIGGPNMILINTNTIIRIVLITLLIIKQNSAEYECNGFGIFKSPFSVNSHIKCFIMSQNRALN